MNKFTKSGLIRLVVALKKVCNHHEEEIERLKRKIYNPFKRKYSDKDIKAIWIDFLKEKTEEQKKFINKVCKIAFGDSAKCVSLATGKPREFTREEVLERLREFSDNALKWEERNYE